MKNQLVSTARISISNFTFEVGKHVTNVTFFNTITLTVGEVADIKALNYQFTKHLIKWQKLRIPTKTVIALTWY